MSIRTYQSFRLPHDAGDIQGNLLRFARQHFDTAVFLNSNGYAGDQYTAFPWIFAMGADDHFVGKERNVFEDLKTFADGYDDWLFGSFTYDLKNQLEHLCSKNPDHIGMPVCHFFLPVVLVMPCREGLRIGTLPGHGLFSDPEHVYAEIMKVPIEQDRQPPVTIQIKQRVSKKCYLKHLKAINEHIQAGTIYEMNYCIEFFAEGAVIDPVALYDSLNSISQSPFSCFYMADDKYLVCASPERFLRKQGAKLISQPIKGTSPRGDSPEADCRMKQWLVADPKERSENVMIVDLVRNDLSRTAQKDSVKVEELYGVYSFRQVHQMISTVTSRIHPDCHYLDVIKNAFPMGSMTGAPKHRAMQLIDRYEDSRRGLYSGAVGYISPEKDFDFNVVIRSVLYNAKKQYLSYMAGSAITIGSDPEKEYEECLLKARAMGKAVLNANAGT